MAGGEGKALADGKDRAGGIPSTSAGSLDGDMRASVGVGLGDTADRGQGVRRGRANRAAAVSRSQGLQVCSPVFVAVLSLYTS